MDTITDPNLALGEDLTAPVNAPGFDCDLFVIGAGSGGVRAARVAAQAGARVMIAEEFRIGGTCVIRGCVPKKLLVYASEYARGFEDAAGFGWTVPAPTFDWPTLRDAVAREVDRLSGIYVRNLSNAGVEIVHDRAELAGPQAVRLVKAGRTVTAARVLIATGGRPVRPYELKGQEHAVTSNEMFGLSALPRRALILGGGYIAVEFATILSGLGVDTTLLYRGETILNGFDDDIRAHCHETLAESGVRVMTGAVLTEIAPEAGGGYRCPTSDGRVIETDLVMLAIGREPYTEGLGLDAAGVATDAKGAVAVDSFSRTSAPTVFAIGDVTNRMNLTPVAIREGQALAMTLYQGQPTAFDHADVATAVFGRPPVGAVGLTEAEARRAHAKVDVYKTTFRPMKHILAHNPQRSLMKLIVAADTGRMLGVHIAGPEAPELIQLAAVAVKAGLTKAQWDATCAVHPTAAEELVLMREKVAEPARLAMG